MLERFKWLLGGMEESRQPETKSGKAIADELFLWFEQHHPLKRFWEIGNAQRGENDEDYPYSHFRAIAVKKLADLIDQSTGRPSVVIGPPLLRW